MRLEGNAILPLLNYKAAYLVIRFQQWAVLWLLGGFPSKSF